MSVTRFVTAAAAALAALLACAAPASAWTKKSHGLIAAAATAKLPEEMPKFFRDAIKELHDLASEPDNWKLIRGSNLSATEGPEHFIDMEYLGGKAFPKTRQDATRFYYSLPADPDDPPDARPERVGYLPWALQEYHTRLALAFREYRKDPENAAARMKCVMYAGLLCHYTGDAAMPLHTTRWYDGLKPDVKGGRPPYKGIHLKIDKFPEDRGFGLKELSDGVKPREIPDVWAHITEFIKESHTHVDRCYGLERDGKIDNPDDATREFISSRTKAATQLTVDLWYSAWLESEKLVKTIRSDW